MPPKNAPKPQDHLPKETSKPPADRIRMVTWDGHEYSIDPTKMDDIDVLEWMGDMDDQPYLIVKIARRMLGDEQYAEFKANHGFRTVKNDDGSETEERTPITTERLGDFLSAVSREVNAVGN